MVCQEKNNILEYFLNIFLFLIGGNLVAMMEFVKNYELQNNSAAFYS